MLQSVKNALLKMERQPGSFQAKLLRFLLNYRNTPHYTTGASPAALLFGRRIRSRLDLIRPPPTVGRRDAVEAKYQSGDAVYCRDYRPGHPKWQPGVIEKRAGTFLYIVRCGGMLIKRHVDQLQKGPVPAEFPQPVPPPVPAKETAPPAPVMLDHEPPVTVDQPPTQTTTPAAPEPQVDPAPAENDDDPPVPVPAPVPFPVPDPVPAPAPPVLERRRRAPPKHLSDFVVGFTDCFELFV